MPGLIVSCVKLPQVRPQAVDIGEIALARNMRTRILDGAGVEFGAGNVFAQLIFRQKSIKDGARR
jgi:hypothetical protein